MNNKQNNWLSSYLAVDIVFDKYETEVATLPAAVTSVDTFKSKLLEIKELRLIQEGHTTGTTLQKQKEEDEMIEATVRVAAAIYVYALSIQDLELQEKAKISSAYLKKLGDSTLLNQCRLVHQLALSLDAEAIAPFYVAIQIFTTFLSGNIEPEVFFLV